MMRVASQLLFYLALALSSFLNIILLGAFWNFGFGQIIEGGPLAILIVGVTLLNPLLFGLLGKTKRTTNWRFVAAGAMLAVVLIYTLTAFGFFGTLPNGRI